MEYIFCYRENCTNPARVSGRCPTHYQQDTRGYAPESRDDHPYQQCAISHCDLEANSRKEGSLCNPHYQLKYRGKNPEDYPLPDDHPARTAPECLEPGCERRSVTKGLCNYHRLRAQKGKTVVRVDVKPNPPCGFPNCGKTSSQAGYCQGHYEQIRRGEDLRPLRVYGKYVKGELRCPIPGCRKPQAVTEVCITHGRMMREYRVSQDQLIEIWRNPTCSNPGCENTTRLHMDHDHSTGEFRALLCGGCNSALGFLKENPERISGLREYIERFHS